MQDQFGAAQRQRCIQRNILRDAAYERVELGFGDHLIHEAEPQRITGLETTRREEDFLRRREADHVDQHFKSTRAVPEAKARGRDRKHRIVCGIAEVRSKRESAAAAHAEAMDVCDQWLREVEQGHEGACVLVVVLFRRRAAPTRLEFGNVGPRYERHFTRAAHDDDADGRIRVERLDRRWNGTPHLGRNRVAPLGMIEDDPADLPIRLSSNTSTHERQLIRGCAHDVSDRSCADSDFGGCRLPPILARVWA